MMKLSKYVVQSGDYYVNLINNELLHKTASEEEFKQGFFLEGQEVDGTKKCLSEQNEILSLTNLFKPRKTLNTKFKRIGSVTDGGYIMADDFREDDFALGLGICNNNDWEIIITKTIAGVHMYDDSITALPLPVRKGKFFKERIGDKQNETCMHEVINRCPSNSDLIMKMDIEGSEWEVLQTCQDLNRFRQMTVEFHDLDNILDETWRTNSRNTMLNILKTHSPVHVHANNHGNYEIIRNVPIPQTIEVLFLRNSSYKFLDLEDPFIGLEYPNNPDKHEIILSF